MEAENKLTEKVITSTLEELILEKKWTSELIEKIEVLLKTNALTDVSSVYKAFQEISAAKEKTSDD